MGEECELQEQASYHFIGRLLNPDDSLRRDVRFLRVKSFKGDNESSCMNTELLAACINSIPKLERFRCAFFAFNENCHTASRTDTNYHSCSWDAETHLTDNLLRTLCQQHPEVELYVSVRTLDHPFLASPQLRSLSVSIPCSGVTNTTSLDAFERLRHILTQNHNLRALSLDVHVDAQLHRLLRCQKMRDAHLCWAPLQHMYYHNSASIEFNGGKLGNDEPMEILKKVQLPLRQSDRLPPLEELTLDAKFYSFDTVHCSILRESIDWSRLKRLKIGSSRADKLFDLLHNSVPQLQCLDFAYQANSRDIYPYLYVVNLRACTQFITTIRKLRELTVRCDTIHFVDPFWGALAHTHGSHLQSLSIQPLQEGLEAPHIQKSPNIRDFLEEYENLSTLDLNLFTKFDLCDHLSGHIQELVSGCEYVCEQANSFRIFGGSRISQSSRHFRHFILLSGSIHAMKHFFSLI